MKANQFHNPHLHKTDVICCGVLERMQLGWMKLEGHCAYCGHEIGIKEMQVDHIIPQYNFISDVKNRWRVPLFLTHLKETDMNHIDNLMPACRICNKWKSAFDLEQFRQEIFEQVKRLNDYSSNFRMAKRYGLVIENVNPIVFYFERGEIFNSNTSQNYTMEHQSLRPHL